jgi:hypothetical protein
MSVGRPFVDRVFGNAKPVAKFIDISQGLHIAYRGNALNLGSHKTILDWLIVIQR